jgi:hypothetical protein
MQRGFWGSSRLADGGGAAVFPLSAPSQRLLVQEPFVRLEVLFFPAWIVNKMLMNIQQMFLNVFFN